MRAYELKSPSIGYAPPEYRMTPWPKEALIAGWFPASAENIVVIMSSTRSFEDTSFGCIARHCQLRLTPPEAMV